MKDEHTVTDEHIAKLFASVRAFIWQEDKRRSNLSKHGIDFEVAKNIFGDPAAYTYTSPRPVLERRYVTIGAAQGTIIAVISTLRGETIRIISARVARREERQLYGRGEKAD
jgi:uncharacterized DUF497 family protein